MQKNHQSDVAAIMHRVARPDWSIKFAVEDQEADAALFRTLFPSKHT
jgi:hypothetical protein